MSSDITLKVNSMCYYIGIEDLVANALIETIRANSDIRFISYREIEAYGAQVISIINNENRKAVLLLSRRDTNHMLSDYSNLFVERDVNGEKGIELKEDIKIEKLIEEFRGYLPLYVLLAFIQAKDKLSIS